MKTMFTSTIALLLLLSGAANAQVPSGNDTSDSRSNTGSGTGALGGPAAENGGSYDTASGYQALHSNTTGSFNTASGFQALYTNTTASDNTAAGYQALYSNTSGFDNVAFGISALINDSSGNSNTGVGAGTIAYNTSGNENTAVGFSALLGQSGGTTTGSGNTGVGADALYSYTTGANNTASGVNALYSDTTGSNNTASGGGSLYDNTTGQYNVAAGVDSLYSNIKGNDNTASGYQALHVSTGSNNVAVGYQAGLLVKTGGNNIEIGNKGNAADGEAANSGVIRIGTQTPTALQSTTYIAGIYDNTSVSGLTVIIDSNGQLGTVKSSERFKTEIAPMGSNTAKLQQLRPVTFHYKSDAQGTLHYGLIAEEVAQVYPELVVRDHEGRIDGVRYEELAPMLVNEMQKQLAENHELKAQLQHQQQQLDNIQAVIMKLQEGERLAAR